MVNDLFRTYKKIIVLVLLLLCAVVFWFYGCRGQGVKKTSVAWEETSSESENAKSYRLETESLKGTVVFGGEGELAEDATIPVTLQVSCKVAAFVGTMKITLPGDNGKGIAWQSAIKCTKNKPVTVTLDVPQLANPSAFCFEILDSFGAAQLTENLSLYTEVVYDSEADVGMTGNLSSETEEGTTEDGDSEADSEEDSEMSLWYVKQTLYAFQNSQLPNTFYYGIFFIVYLLVVAGIAYYYLRRRKKREYIWFVVPALAFVFTAGLFVRTWGMAENADGTFSALRIADTEREGETIYLLHQSEEGENQNVKLLPKITALAPLDYSYSVLVNVNENVKPSEEDYTINDTKKGFDVDFEEAAPGSANFLRLKSDQKETKENAFSQNVTPSADGFVGTVKNLSGNRFSKVILVWGEHYVLLDAMAANASADVSKAHVYSLSDEEEGYIVFLSDSRLLDNVMAYIQQAYMLDDADASELKIIGITEETDFSVFSDKNKLENHVSVVVNHFALPDDGEDSAQTKESSTEER